MDRKSSGNPVTVLPEEECTRFRVCIVAPTAYPILAGDDFSATGGAESQLVLIGRGLAARGHTVTFLVRDHGQEARSTHAGADAMRCPFRYLGGPKRWLVPDTLGLVRCLRKQSPHIVLTKGPQLVMGPLGVARHLLPFRLVKIAASMWDCERTPGAAGLVYRAGCRTADRLVFQTRMQQDLCVRELRLGGEVIPNLAHELPSPPPDSRVRWDALWVGGCDANKRPLTYLDVVAALPHRRFAMVLAPRDRALQVQVEATARRLANLDYLGFLPYARTQELFAQARVVVGTSRREGFPNVYLQAWQAAIPVASLVVDPDGIIARHELGVVVGDDASGLVQAVESLVSRPERCRVLGTNGMRYVADHHSPQIVLAHYEALFARLCRTGGGP